MKDTPHKSGRASENPEERGMHRRIDFRGDSNEGPTPLETDGGIRRTLSMHGEKPFIVVSADIYSDYDYAELPAEPNGLTHLIMVQNPEFHPRGDFWLDGNRLSEAGESKRLTFGNIDVYRPEMFASEADGRFKLLPIYQRAMSADQLTGECYTGLWRNIGTPEQLLEPLSL